eukprot:12053144-Karenia_brevis.AAC.1
MSFQYQTHFCHDPDLELAIIYQLQASHVTYVGRSSCTRRSRANIGGTSCPFKDHATSYYKHLNATI